MRPMSPSNGRTGPTDYQKGMVAGALLFLIGVFLIRAIEWVIGIMMNTTLQAIINKSVAWGTTEHCIAPFEVLYGVGVIGLVVLLGSVIIAYMML